MTTWISNAPQAVLACLALTACDALPVLENLTQPSDAAKAAPAVALSETKMASGAFTLVPPQGFCIDKNSLNQRFALMARCDTLGAPDLAAGAPLAIIAVSVAAQDAADVLPTAEDTAHAAKLARVDAAKSENDALTFRAEGPPPASDMDVIHWRGAMRAGGQIVGLTLYGPKGGRAVSAEGREVLNDLIRRTQEASKPDA